MLKGVLSKNLQNPIYAAEGCITAEVTVHTMLTNLLGATDDRGGYHWFRGHTPLGRILQVFTDKAF